MSTQNLKALATGRPAQSSQPTGEIVPESSKQKFDRFEGMLKNSKARLLPMLGNKNENVDAFVSVCLNAVSNNPALLDADIRSLLVSCMRAANDGLIPDGRDAVLNIYNTKKKINENGREVERWVPTVQYLPMVGGIVKALYKHPDVSMVDAACVYQNDKFKFVRGDNPCIEHEPVLDKDPGEVIAAYCIVTLKSGEKKREVMPRRDIDKARAASKSGGNGPWVTWFDQQAIKSVIKRGSKLLPRHDAFDRIAQSDNDAMGYTNRDEDIASALNQTTYIEPLPALTDEPSPTLDNATIVPQRDEAFDRVDQAGEARGEARQEPERQSFAQLEERIQKAKDRELAEIILDEARHLSPDMQKDLAKAIESRFPRAK